MSVKIKHKGESKDLEAYQSPYKKHYAIDIGENLQEYLDGGDTLEATVDPETGVVNLKVIEGEHKEGNLKKMGKAVQGVAHIKHPNGVTETEETTVTLSHFEGPTANVGFKMGLTKQMKTDYESIRIDVSLNMPCEPLLTSIDESYEFVEGWVDTKVEEMLIKLKKAGIIKG